MRRAPPVRREGASPRRDCAEGASRRKPTRAPKGRYSPYEGYALSGAFHPSDGMSPKETPVGSSRREQAPFGSYRRTRARRVTFGDPSGPSRKGLRPFTRRAFGFFPSGKSDRLGAQAPLSGLRPLLCVRSTSSIDSVRAKQAKLAKQASLASLTCAARSCEATSCFATYARRTYKSLRDLGGLRPPEWATPT